MKSVVFALALMFASLCGASVRAEDGSASDAEKAGIRRIVKEVLREYAAALNPQLGFDDAKPILKDILQANRNFAKAHRPSYFQPFVDEQHPRATVVTCSDSRVQTPALDASPDNDLFMVRDIGNQLATAQGSVEYGVHHLHTPLLLIVGHTHCGAIKAAAGDYSKESGAIKRELDTIQIPKGEAGLSSIKLNVHNQVKVAMDKFEEDVLAGHLTVVGAVYDFTDEMKQGQGRLNIINVNGETDPRVIGKFDFMQEEAPVKPAKRSRTSLYTPAKLALAPTEGHEAKVEHKPEAKAEHKVVAKAEAKVEAKPKPASEQGAKSGKKHGLIKLPGKPAEMDVPSDAKSEKLVAAKPAPKPVAKSKKGVDEEE